MICNVKKLDTCIGHTPFTVAVKVTVTVPLAPASGLITGGFNGKTFGVPVPGIKLAGPAILQEYSVEF